VKGKEDGVVSLLHYDDAAGACVAALRMRIGGDGDGMRGDDTTNNNNDDDDDDGGRVFLVSDGSPTTRRGICESALKSERYSDESMPIFEEGTDVGGTTGKVYDASWTNKALGWKPVYPSFDEFISSL